MSRVSKNKEVKHRLYGNCRFNILVRIETDCSKCIHKRVCKRDVSLFCKNYEFGTSEYSGCCSCSHYFTRVDEVSIPCFRCSFFKKR